MLCRGWLIISEWSHWHVDMFPLVIACLTCWKMAAFDVTVYTGVYDLSLKLINSVYFIRTIMAWMFEAYSNHYFMGEVCTLLFTSDMNYCRFPITISMLWTCVTDSLYRKRLSIEGRLLHLEVFDPCSQVSDLSPAYIHIFLTIVSDGIRNILYVVFWCDLWYSPVAQNTLYTMNSPWKAETGSTRTCWLLMQLHMVPFIRKRWVLLWFPQAQVTGCALFHLFTF